ncbi:transcription termination factor Rho [Pseudonocardia sediminis]|uniref:Transcription termination factor Rho n=1 Tax=Pseudonocardia sediminis TaxID=1397368 RepID=A0A4Q7V5N4_PSEST|nr:transcription termination factor Rho [Pseudonocardia sediminis]RZT88073.1 transcription termination factor Rho [Pseudonocardia sediminis]
MSETDLVGSQSADTEAAPRRRGGLSGMVLAELRELATELNVPDIAGMRKGDLIAAIKERQGAASAPAAKRASRPAPRAATSSDDSPAEAPQLALGDTGASNGAVTSDDAAETPAAPAAPTRRRRAASRPAGAPSTESKPAAVTTETAPSTPVAEAAPAVEAPASAAPVQEVGDGAGSRGSQDSSSQDGASDDTGSKDTATTDAGSQDSQPEGGGRRGRTRRRGGDTESADAQEQNGSANGTPTESPRTDDGRQNGNADGDTRQERRERNRSRGGNDQGDNGRGSDNRGESRDRNGGNRDGNGRGNDTARGNDNGRGGDNGRDSGRGNDNGRGGNDTRNDRNDSRNDSRNDNGRNNDNGRGGNGNRNDRNDNRGNDDTRGGNGRGGNDTRNDVEDDDGDGRGRRGRRFRDRRRGRDRERTGSGGGGNVDTEIRDDDVLLPVAGIVDILDNYAFVRTTGYLSGPTDVYVSMSMVRKNGLRRGDAITGAVRQPRENEQQRAKFNPLVRVDTVNGSDPEVAKARPEFTKLTPLYPNERLRLETEPTNLTTRVIDLVMPVGKGQRALIVSPPKAGKTTIMQNIANAITTNNPECHLMVVLVDERPEEVTDMQRSVKGEVIASTFDRPPSDHTTIAELSIERAKRLVEMGYDVVVLLDNITRLGRAYNLAAPASGRILSGGVDSTALYPPKRFLGAARNIEDGGSLTIFATALVETGSTMDTVIFEEFKGTGNAELKLDRKIADKRVFPAIDVGDSGTRKEELLMSADEHAVMVKLRRVLAALDDQQAIDLVLNRLKKSKTNIEFMMEVAKSTPGKDED